jgi:hypothetical protein
MLTIGLCVLIGLVVGCWLAYRDMCDAGYAMFFGLMIGCVGGLVGLPMAFAVGGGLPTERVETRTKLASLRNVDGIGGSFFLGSGQIQSEPYYFYYEGTERGYVLKKIRATDNVFVKEEDRKDGELFISEPRCADSLWGFCTLVGNTEKTFIIPKGSLRQTFALQ